MANADTHQWTATTSRHGINWSAAIWASVIAGLVFAALEMVLVRVVDGASPWMPLHLIGAIGLGPSALSPANTFDVKVVGDKQTARRQAGLASRSRSTWLSRSSTV